MQNQIPVNTYCLVIDIIGSTKEILMESTSVRDSFNFALSQVLSPFLEKMELENAYIKFTGDGWIISIENAKNLTHLICFASLLNKKFNNSIIELTEIKFTNNWNLRLAIGNGQDIKVEFNKQVDFVGDSIRRATRISTLCLPNELLVDLAIYRDTLRDFDYVEINVDERITDIQIKKFEHDIGNSVYSMNAVKYSSLKNADIIIKYFDEIGYHKEKEEIIAEVIAKTESKDLSINDMETIDKSSIALSSIGRNQTGDEIYKKIQEQGYNRSLINWNKQLHLTNNYEKANKVFKQIKRAGLTPDEITFNTLMNKVVDFEQAKEVLREMKAENIIPDEITYSTLMKKVVDFEQAKEVLREMKAENIIPDEITYSTLMNKVVDFEQAKEVLREMETENIKPDEITFNTLMNKVVDFEQAKEVLREMKAENIIPDEITFNTLMNKVVDFEQAKEVLMEMKTENIIPDIFTYSTLFSKKIGNYTARDIHLWYVKEEKFHPSGAIEGLIKNLFWGKRLIDAYYLILHYPHLSISKKIVKENFSETILMYNKFKQEPFYNDHIDYALGIAYFEQQKFQKAKKYLENVLVNKTIDKQKKHVEILLTLIANKV